MTVDQARDQILLLANSLQIEVSEISTSRKHHFARMRMCISFFLFSHGLHPEAIAPLIGRSFRQVQKYIYDYRERICSENSRLGEVADIVAPYFVDLVEEEQSLTIAA